MKRNGKEKASYLHHFRTVRSIGELKAVWEKMRKNMPLFLTTVRIPHDTFEEESNSKIKKFVEENDHTYLIDWYAASEGHDEYFDADDTHLLSAGAKAYAKCIKEAVLAGYIQEGEYRNS